VESYKTHILSHTIPGNKGHLLQLPMLFDFKPGQVARLGLKGLYPPRIYSFAGSDFNTWVEFLFDVRPGGFLSPRLVKLKNGDEIFISAMCLRRNCRKITSAAAAVRIKVSFFVAG